MHVIRAGIVAALLTSSWTGASPAGATGGRACPVERQHEVAPLGPVVGDGPVYTSFGPDNRVRFRTDDSGGAWRRMKVGWLVEPGSAGPVVVRGRRVDASGKLRFGEGPDPATSLDLPAESNSFLPGVSDLGWRFFPSIVRVKVPGCYRVTVRSEGAVQTLHFRAAFG
jgi:hypothetical protein